MNWFKHDYSAAEDDKILELRSKYGWEGYGIFFAILEYMCKTEKGLDKKRLGSLKVVLSTPEGYLEGYLEDMVEIGLFFDENGVLWNQRIKDHIASLNKRRIDGSNAGKKSAKSRSKKNELNQDSRLPSRLPSTKPSTDKSIYTSKKDIADGNKKYDFFYPEDFENVWEMYGRKGGKKKAYEEWRKLPNDIKQIAIDHIPEYVNSFDDKDRSFMKDFERYLSNHTFYSVVVSRNKDKKQLDDDAEARLKYYGNQ